MVKVREDMTGRKMWEHGVPDSRLIVIEQVEDYINPASGQHVARWRCQCTCQNPKTVEANGTDIANGRVKSCGCIVRENATERMKNFGKKAGEWKRKSNKYDLTGEYGVGWTSNTNKEFYFDLEDYDKIKDYCWSENIDSKGYSSLRAYSRGCKRELIIMFWILVGKNFDHIDRNPLNNRKNNLRPATCVENRRNSSKRKDNTSGVTGVHLDKRSGAWVSSISYNNKNRKVYWGKNKEDAIRARLEAEAKYYGEFAPQKHLFEQYGITIQNELEESDELQVV